MNSSTPMTSDRNLLTDKELLYIKDYLSWELLAMKKYHEAAQACTDQEITSLLRETGRKHQEHYDLLCSHLQ